MKLLNKHLLDERPAGAVYMPHVMVRFVRQNKAELLQAGLAVEFWKWLSNSVMMGVLDAEGVRVCMELLRDGVEEGKGDFFGRNDVQERKGKRVKIEEEKEPKWKGVCTCDRPWVRSEMVRCDGKVSLFFLPTEFSLLTRRRPVKSAGSIDSVSMLINVPRSGFVPSARSSRIKSHYSAIHISVTYHHSSHIAADNFIFQCPVHAPLFIHIV